MELGKASDRKTRPYFTAHVAQGSWEESKDLGQGHFLSKTPILIHDDTRSSLEAREALPLAIADSDGVARISCLDGYLAIADCYCAVSFLGPAVG